jgi:hypothetical protein
VVYVKFGETKTGCEGSAAEPAAEAGFLCVYEGELSNFGGSMNSFFTEIASGTGGFAAPSGAAGGVIIFDMKETKPGEWQEATAYGSWAVTAP